MADGLLGMIANPQIANVPGQIAAGRQSALQKQLLQAQLEGQQGTNVEQQRVSQLRQQLSTMQPGTPEFESGLRQLAISTQTPTQTQTFLQNVDNASTEKAFKAISFAGLANNEADQNRFIDIAISNTTGNEEAQIVLNNLKSVPFQQRGLAISEINQIGQQLGVLKAAPEKPQVKFLKTVGNMAVVQDTDGTIKTVDVPGLELVTDEDKEMALNVGSTVTLKNGKIGRVVTVPRTGATRIEVASLPEGVEVETQDQISARKVKETEQKEAARLLSKARATTKNRIITAGRDADREIIRLKRIKTALNFVETGKIAQAKKILGPYIPGIDPSEEQAMEALLQGAVFPVLANFKGPTTDFEFQKAADTIAQLGNTPRANSIIVESLIQFMNDRRDERDQFREFLKNKGNPEDFDFIPTIIKEVKTQAEYDALAPGTIYLEDGKEMRKPYAE